MIREWVREWLGIDNLETSVDNLNNKLSHLEDGSVSRVPSDVTNSEQQVLEVVTGNQFLAVEDISNILGKTKNCIRVYLYRLKNKVSLEVEKDGRKKLYRYSINKKEIKKEL